MLINAIEPEEEKSSQRQFVDKILTKYVLYATTVQGDIPTFARNYT